jgi:signal transduction histidine kinase
MTNRASLYNGKTRIISSPGKGCYLEVTVPLAQEEKN